MDLYFYCLLIFTSAFVESESRPTLVDTLPLVSQVKYLFLYAIGKKEEADQTWNNFKNTTHLMEHVRHLDESIPVVGHIEAVVFKFQGDKERAEEILASANKGTLILGGLLLAGPAGAITGSIAGDGLNSVMLKKPVGIIDNVVNFKDKSAGDDFDAAAELVLAGTLAKGPGKVVKTSVKTLSMEMKPIAESGVKRVRFNDEVQLINPEEVPSEFMAEFRASMERNYGAIPRPNQQPIKPATTITGIKPAIKNADRVPLLDPKPSWIQNFLNAMADISSRALSGNMA